MRQRAGGGRGKGAATKVDWNVNRERRGMMYAQDGRETWVVHYQVPPRVDWRAVDAKAVVAAMIGGDVEFEIISGGPWTGGVPPVGRDYPGGRPFFCARAARLVTPLLPPC